MTSPTPSKKVLRAIKSVQKAFAPYRVEGVSVVDELIRERREEASREYDE